MHRIAAEQDSKPPPGKARNEEILPPPPQRTFDAGCTRNTRSAVVHRSREAGRTLVAFGTSTAWRTGHAFFSRTASGTLLSRCGALDASEAGSTVRTGIAIGAVLTIFSLRTWSTCDTFVPCQAILSRNTRSARGARGARCTGGTSAA